MIKTYTYIYIHTHNRVEKIFFQTINILFNKNNWDISRAYSIFNIKIRNSQKCKTYRSKLDRNLFHISVTQNNSLWSPPTAHSGRVLCQERPDPMTTEPRRMGYKIREELKKLTKSSKLVSKNYPSKIKHTLICCLYL